MTEICPITFENVRFIVNNIRDIDIDEIFEVDGCESKKQSLKNIEEGIWNVGGLRYVIQGENPIVVGGVIEVFPGVGQAWALATSDFNKYPVSITKQSKSLIKCWLESGFRRIQVDSAEFHTASHKWLEICGYHLESIREGHGRTSNFRHYVILNGRSRR